MPPKRQRLIFILLSVGCLSVATLLILNALRDNILYFRSPSELTSLAPQPGEAFRLGGLVETGSVVRSENNIIHFNITDGQSTIAVTYQGMLPTLFREGQGVVAEGTLTTEPTPPSLQDEAITEQSEALRGSTPHSNYIFKATRILAKHDENYMPREVVDALKKSGRWQEGKELAP